MEVIEALPPQTAKNSKFLKPKIISWKGTRMLRNHSFLATINDIVEFSSEIDVTRVGIIGDMHSGKTTMAKAIGHAVHKKAWEKFKIPFAIRIFYQEDLMNFQDTLKTLTPTNYVLVFDDVTFLDSNKRELNAVKQAVTKIRHLEGGEDVKIILIYNYHYNLGFDKFLRQADFRYFTSVGSSETENMEKIVKSKNMPLVWRFIKMRRKAIVKKYWSVKVGAKESFSYKWRNPFIPVLFFDSEKLRLIISPTREFMDKVCSVCATAEGVRYQQVPVEEVAQEGENKFGERVFKSAVRLKLFENGMAVYAKSLMQGKKWLDNNLNKKLITLEQLMIHYGFSITKTRVKQQYMDLIEKEEKGLKKTDDSKKSVFR